MPDILDVMRVEKKYSLSLQEILNLNDKLSKVLHQDKNNNAEDGYIVRSLYFDTLGDHDYYEKEDGIEQRRKIRLRTYGTDDAWAKLELKEKQGEFQRKRSLMIGKEEAYSLIQGKYSVLLSYDNPLAGEVFGMMSTKLYRPKCIVEYKRRAFCVPENDIRITLDTRLLASETNFDLFAGNQGFYPVDVQDKGILEVKYNRFILSYIKDILSLGGRSQISYSKYCMARRITKGI